MRHWLSRSLCRPEPGLVLEASGKPYVLGGRIGNGAVGIVRKARDRASGRLVAVKFLAPDPKYIEPSAFDDVRERFRREGMRGAGLKNDNLVQVLAYEDNESGKCFKSRNVKNPFIIMEYVRGRTLESLIRNLGPTPTGGAHITRQTLSIASSIASALHHLHERKIVHRDVKPANIFISNSQVGAVPSQIKLGDFGVTKWGDFLSAMTTGKLTMSSQRGLGTLKYMSPEQAIRPSEVTVRSDMFSLGITLFELFTGSLLPGPHHVFEIVSARNMRGSITGKLSSLGVKRLAASEEAVFEQVLGMFMAASGRPTSKQTANRFEFWLERIQQ
jgi:serine/threonine protein kinase